VEYVSHGMLLGEMTMSLVQDVPPVSHSIWPYDTAKAPDTSPPRQFDKFRCFVLCPFARAEIVMFMVSQSAKQIRKVLGHQIEVYYAGDFGGPGAIHPDIWVHIKQADIVVADLTGYNPNVVYELGVAAAWRPIDTVIILLDRNDAPRFAFDLQPARQRIYDSRTRGWMDQLGQWLMDDMLQCLIRVPFHDEPAQPISLPLDFRFENDQDTPDLWSPGPGHRRSVEGGLEFGSPFYFPYSWLSAVRIRPTDVRVKAELRFTDRADPCWIGIALRSQGYLANQGHLAWLDAEGNVNRTCYAENAEGKDEHNVGRLSDFDPNASEFISFDISINSGAWTIRVGDVDQVIPLTGLPYVFGPGRILLQTYRCRATLRRVHIGQL
jgi:hypothetical protein